MLKNHSARTKIRRWQKKECRWEARFLSQLAALSSDWEEQLDTIRMHACCFYLLRTPRTAGVNSQALLTSGDSLWCADVGACDDHTDTNVNRTQNAFPYTHGSTKKLLYVNNISCSYHAPQLDRCHCYTIWCVRELLSSPRDRIWNIVKNVHNE